jgi:hypothetical protein
MNRNKKSDVKAKAEYVEYLKANGYCNPKVIASPADITAEKNGDTWYFEIKKTSQENKYFGAATLTEWIQALKDPDHFRFVIARESNEEKFDFFEYTPSEFMEISSIPPFKVFFNVDFRKETQTSPGKSGAIKATKDRINYLSKVFSDLKNK